MRSFCSDQCPLPLICRTLKLIRVGYTRRVIHHVALQQSDVLRAQFMGEISVYDPKMIIWIDVTEEIA